MLQVDREERPDVDKVILLLTRGTILIILVYNGHHSFTTDVCVSVMFDYVFNLNENEICLGQYIGNDWNISEGLW